MKFVKFLTIMISALFFVGCGGDGDNSGAGERVKAKWLIEDSNSSITSIELLGDGGYIVISKSYSSGSVKALSYSGDLSVSLSFDDYSRAEDFDTPFYAQSQLSPIHFGTYEIKVNTITLKGFGVLEIIRVTADEFEFSFSISAVGEGKWRAKKASIPINNSERSKMICKIWRITNVIWHTIPPNGLYTKARIGDMLIISRAGTYLFLYSYYGSSSLTD